MNAPTFGYTPTTEELATPQGCDIAIRNVGSRKATIHQLMQRHRSVRDREPYVEELARLDVLRRDLIDRRHFLLDIASGRQERFHRTFWRVVREHVGTETAKAWGAEANAILAAEDAKLSSLTHGPALEPYAGGTGVQTRRTA